MKIIKSSLLLCMAAGLALFLSACGGGGGGGTTAAVVSFSPSSGAVGTLLTLSGTDFTSAQSVSVGGSAAIILSQSSSLLTAMVMPGAATGSVSVTSTAGTTAAPGTFTVSATGIPATQQGNKLVGTGAAGTTANQGISVAVSADGNTAVVGGNADNGNAGAAWVYTRSAGVWAQQGLKLVGTSAAGTSANQGTSVAVSADGNTAVVGGPGDNGNAGAAWVYTRSGGVWTQQGNKLVGSLATGAANQGSSVALSADGNTAVVGGFNDNAGAGAAWVYTRSGGAWTQQGAKLVGSNPVGAAQQGTSVALSADGNTAVVGGPGGNNSGVGAAWVYTRSGGAWTQQGANLVGSGAVGAARQGWSVAVSADGNTAVVGGYGDNSYAGAAWVYARSGGVWAQQGAKLVGTGAAGTTANQGISVAVSADGNTAVVGGDGGNSSGAGAAWVYARSGGAWTQQGAKLVGTGVAGASANQGRSVALSADGNTAVVGGHTDNSGAGAAWVYIP